MTDFIRRLVDRGLGAVPAGLPTPVPAYSRAGSDAKHDKTASPPSIPKEMREEVESAPKGEENVVPAIDSRAFARSDASPRLPTALADRSPRIRRADRAGQALRDREPAQPGGADEVPVKAAKEPRPLRTATPTSEVGDARVQPPSISTPRPDSPLPVNVTGARSYRSPPDSRVSSSGEAVVSGTLAPNRDQWPPEIDNARESERGDTKMIRGAAIQERDGTRPTGFNASSMERPTLSPRSADDPRDIAMATPVHPLPVATSAAEMVVEALRPRANATRDPVVQPLSPRTQRAADLSPIMTSHRAPAGERSVSVHIGTIEVRSETPAPVVSATPPAAPPAPGFEEYAALRSYASWSHR